METINTKKEYILGIDRRKLVKSNDWLVYKMDTTDLVKIFTVNYIIKKAKKRRAEFYYPPEFDFKQKTPAIVLFTVKKYPMDRASYVSWAQMLAANGFIAITYEAPDYENDFKYLLNYIYQNEFYLSINLNKIGVIAFCGALNRYFSMNFMEIEKYNISYGIFFSGTIPSPHKYKYSYPLLIVNSGKDYKVCSQSFKRFKIEADKLGLNYKMIDFPKGIHRFDAFQPTEGSKKTIKLMIKEMRNYLFY
jgi:hypothetical protein